MKKSSSNSSNQNKILMAVAAVVLAVGAFLIFQKSPEAEVKTVETAPIEQEITQPETTTAAQPVEAPEVLPPVPAEQPSLGASSSGLGR